jgi:4-amino-4-deoxychorismate lyase
MYPLVESVRIENRHLQHIELHNQRISDAIQAVYQKEWVINIAALVEIPAALTNERYKCRLVFYPDRVDYTIDLYHQRAIKTLKVVIDNAIEYRYKSENREKLNIAYAHRGSCDDILIVKNGFVTDSWAANLLLFDGEHWITPNTPLLKGVQRAYLLNMGIIKERKVTIGDIPSYQKIKLINAMIDFERAPEIVISEGVFF